MMPAPREQALRKLVGPVRIELTLYRLIPIALPLSYGPSSWWTGTVTLRVFLRAKQMCYLLSLQAQISNRTAILFIINTR